MVSDPPQTYDADRIGLMKRTMPPLATHAGEFGPIDYSTPACTYIPKTKTEEEASYAIAHEKKGENYPMGSLWSIHMEQGGRNWCVIQRCGVTPLETANLPLEKVCLNPSRTYYAFDFWKQLAWKCTDGVLNMHELALGDCQVVALTDITDKKIALLGSDRHVSCDAVSVLTETITDTPDGMDYRLELKGFEGLHVTYTLYAENAADVTKEALHEAIHAQGAQIASVQAEEDLLQIEVVFECENATVELKLNETEI